jgi:hypothetical protein
MPVKARSTNITWSHTGSTADPDLTPQGEIKAVAVSIPDPGGANADLANYIAWNAPTAVVITKLELVPETAWVAAAPANDATVAVKRNNTGTAVASLAVQTALAAGSENDMGALDATTKILAAGDNLTVDVTTNGTADAPRQTLLIEYKDLGADQTNMTIFRAPFDCEIMDIRVIPQKAWVAAAAANDGSVAVKRNNTGTALGTLSVTTALAAGSDNQLAATLDATTKLLVKGDTLTADVTANGTADAPAHDFFIHYRARREAGD